MTANLDVKNYDGDHYYMWDAQNQYWYGYEWTKNLPAGTGQPTLNGNNSSNYAQSNADPNHRWYHEGGGTARFDAIHTPCKNLPQRERDDVVRCRGRSPIGDADELWTTMGHLYKGGIWFKKKSVLQGRR